MPHPHLQEFLKALERDPALKRKFERAPDVDAAAAVAREAGFDVLAIDLIESEELDSPPGEA